MAVQGRAARGIVLLLLISPGLAEQNPRSAAAENERGVALQRDGDLLGAIRAFRQAVDINPKYAGAITNLGHALREAGNVREAIACFERVTALEPRSGA